jgi:uncharacterized membrane protein
MKLLPESAFRQILLAHFAATCAMAGVIWIVQLVIYPQFSHVGAEVFPPFHAQYTGLVTLVVGPLMIVEIVTATLIFLQLRSVPVSRHLALAGLATVLLLWVITALVQVPAHEQIGTAYTDEQARHLVLTNWPRTLLWTLRIPLAWVLISRR